MDIKTDRTIIGQTQFTAPGEHTTTNTQFLLFTLLGDYVAPHGGKIWTADLLSLLELLGVGESSARSTLSRMSRNGWLKAHREGRRSRYDLTPKGLALIEDGRKRIFEPLLTDWDGRWYVVVYALNEKQRQARNALRKQLAWLGYGRLAPATWISPHQRRAELAYILQDLQIQPYVQLFSGEHLGLTSPEILIQHCWDLPALAAEYRHFVNRYQATYERLKEGPNGCVTPEACFVQRFWITHDFQPFPRKDPNLPVTLLPPDWIGFTARRLFEGYRQLLAPGANDFVDEVMSK